MDAMTPAAPDAASFRHRTALRGSVRSPFAVAPGYPGASERQPERQTDRVGRG
ncbi:MAG TPA: hypothetical protein VIL69_01165 [Roseomonas sp.]|jgi:hypothetical protein